MITQYSVLNVNLHLHKLYVSLLSGVYYMFPSNFITTFIQVSPFI